MTPGSAIRLASVNNNGIVCKAYFVTDCCILVNGGVIIFNRIKLSLEACLI